MSNYKLNYWEEAISSSLEEHGLLSDEAKKHLTSIAKDMVNAEECHSQAFGWDAIPNPAKAEHKEEITRLLNQIKDLEDQILCYRQSVATRRGVPIEQVHINHHGEVIYSNW